MDGVLCDFEKGVIKAINRELASKNPKNPELAAVVVNDLGRNYVTVDDIQKFFTRQIVCCNKIYV